MNLNAGQVFTDGVLTLATIGMVIGLAFDATYLGGLRVLWDSSLIAFGVAVGHRAWGGVK